LRTVRYLGLWALVVGCGSAPEPAVEAPTEPSPVASAPAEQPAPAAGAPSVAWEVADREVRSPVAVPLSPEIQEARAALVDLVSKHARDPANPWAVTHAILALGPDVELTNGQPAIDWLFSEYATVETVGEDSLIRFPSKRGSIRIEPHADLVLKALTEAGVRPDRKVVVQGKEMRVGDLYRGSLRRAWTDGDKTGASSFNDTPWTLQAVATWAPSDLAWQAVDGHAMTMDGYASDVTAKLHADSAFMRDAIAAGEIVQKRRQGIFSYTCGGAHLLQGAAYAVARGFGGPESRSQIEQQMPVLYWRYGLELNTVDQAMKMRPDYRLILTEQKLKFIGHFLESGHKIAAMGLASPQEAQPNLDKAMADLVVVVGQLSAGGILERVGELKPSQEQLYLDFVGDSAHAVRGIDMATGVGVIRL